MTAGGEQTNSPVTDDIIQEVTTPFSPNVSVPQPLISGSIDIGSWTISGYRISSNQNHHPSIHPPVPRAGPQSRPTRLTEGSNDGSKRSEPLTVNSSAAAFIALSFLAHLFETKELWIYVTCEAAGFALRRPTVACEAFLWWCLLVLQGEQGGEPPLCKCLVSGNMGVALLS